MLTIQGITVRLGGRNILDGASVAIPPRGKVGLIGRNGAGKSTLVKAIIGEIEPDEGSVDMPRRTRLGYIAQEAPSGTATPFETVLASDEERTALLAESETCHDPDRLGDVHERLLAIDAYSAPSRAAHVAKLNAFSTKAASASIQALCGRPSMPWPLSMKPRSGIQPSQ